MWQPPPPAPDTGSHPESDDWDFLTDQFITSTSLGPSPSTPGTHPSISSASSNPFLSLSPETHLSPNPFLSPSSDFTNPFLFPSSSSGPHLSTSFSDSPQIHTPPAGPHRSASLPFSPIHTTPDRPVSVPGPLRSASLSNSPRSSDSGYWTPPSGPPSYSGLSDPSFWTPPAGAQHNGSLPEFSGRVTNDPIYQPLGRTIIDQTRPVPLTLRPRPSRESQNGFFLRSIVFYPPSYLWAGHESGLRVWNTDQMFDQMSNKKNIRRGDEESVPYVDSRITGMVMCMTVDLTRDIVWSGHVDGRIMGWKANGSDLLDGFEECVLWDAHQRFPVLSIAVTPYGEIWSGSEGGVIKVWSIGAINESLSSNKEEQHKVSSLLERSCVDLRSLVTDGGACPIPSVDVKLLLCDNSGSKVWSGGYLSIILWDCRTKELIKIINSIDGSVETRFENPDPFQNDSFKKEKSRTSPNFFQRSKNALKGAADIVRKAAVKVAFGDDIRRLESIASSADGTVWFGCANGSISQWDINGSKLQEFMRNSAPVQCICSYGTRVWIGYSDGKVQIMDLDAKLLSSWYAHKSPILKITIGGNYVFTLAGHGGIRGWTLLSPGPIDGVIRAELAEREGNYKRLKHVKMVVGTWNVGQEKASFESIKKWIGFEVKDEIGLVVIGLQEVDMGAGFLAMAAAKETVGFEGSPSPNGEWWLDAIGRVLGGTNFERVLCRQMAGLLIAVWVRKNLKQYIGDVESAVVACGLGHAIGNKGAVGLRLRIYGRIMCFVNCHLAAHLEAVTRRNEDFDHIYRTMTFAPPAGSSTGPSLRGVNGMNNRKTDLAETDMVVFLGDFNYRLDNTTYEEATELIYNKKFDKLRAKDQLRAEMKSGRVFQGLREAQIKFPATYKFDKYITGLSGYDSSDKKRIPAWCDRILYRDSRTGSGSHQCSLDCPVVSSVSLYDACMEALDSDHKPVKCVFNIDIAYVDESARRQEYGDIISSNKKIKSLLDESKIVPDISLSTSNIALKNQEISVLRVINKSRNDNGSFEIFCLDENRRGVLPKWLKVNPASGIINPGQNIQVNIQHGDLYSQDFYEVKSGRGNEETREKTAILVFKINSNYSNETKSFKINLSYTGSRDFSSRSQIW